MQHILLSALCLTVGLGLSCDDKAEKAGSAGTEDEPGTSSSAPDPSLRTLATMPANQRANYYSELPAQTITEGKRYIATIQTNKGDIVLELDAISAPLHTNNFVFLARQGFYDDLTWHRVMARFMAQGGDPLGTGTGGPGYRIPAEFGLTHQQGVIAMARQPDAVNPQKMSSGSQFYITLEPQPHLDQGGYSVFGRVSQGFEVVQKLKNEDMIHRIDIDEK